MELKARSKKRKGVTKTSMQRDDIKGNDTRD